MAACVIGFLGVALGASRLATQLDYGDDFAVYRVAGSAVLHHESLFGPWMGQHMTFPLPFTYPPLAAVLAIPFALLGQDVGYLLWNVVSIAALFAVVRETTRPLVARFDRPALALASSCALALALAPVQEELRYGQVGIVLMALCLFDCTRRPQRVPQGALVGAATAVKLIPGIFIPYLWLTGRRRATGVAVSTFVLLSLAAATVTLGDSRSFWTSRVFDNSRVGGLAYISNQSLNGLVARAFGSDPHVVWIALAGPVAVFGLRHAARAARQGDDILGIAIVGLVGVLVSPVSWIHHLVWVVPALAVLVGDGRDRRRFAIAVSAAALFTLRLPFLAQSIPAGWHIGWISAVLRDADGLVCLFLLFVLASLVPAPLRSGPTPPSARTRRRARRRSLPALRTRAPRR